MHFCRALPLTTEVFEKVIMEKIIPAVSNKKSEKLEKSKPLFSDKPAMSKTAQAATFLSLLGSTLCFLAFISKSWVVSDETLENPKFQQIGLWVVCFKGFQDPHHWYDYKFNDCLWVYDRDYGIVYDILIKSDYLATQFWFSTCMLFVTIGLLYTRLFSYLDRSYERNIHILCSAGFFYGLAALSGSVALVVFATNGAGRFWMPHWEHNEIGWSYGVAVSGIFALYISSILYLIEGRVHVSMNKKMKAVAGNPNFTNIEFTKTNTNMIV